MKKHDIGEFGNYLCDAPATLVRSAVQAMAKIEANPALILWTGDSVPHVPSTEYNTSGTFFSIVPKTPLPSQTSYLQ